MRKQLIFIVKGIRNSLEIYVVERKPNAFTDLKVNEV